MRVAMPLDEAEMFAAVKAALVGTKTVIRGVESKTEVWSDALVRATHVVSPVDSAVEDSVRGTVKRL